MKRSNILIVGDFAYDIYEESLAKSLEKKSINVLKFKIGEYYNFITHPSVRKTKVNYSSIFKYIQVKYRFGPLLSKINKELITFIENNNNNIDIIFLYRPVLIKASSLDLIKKKYPNIQIVSYNNDSAFSKKYPSYFWKHYLECCNFTDLNLAYRHSDLLHLKKKSVRSELFLPSYADHISFVKEPDIKYKSDVIFIGHFEDDKRDYYLLELLKEGINLSIFGTGWDKSELYSEICSYLGREIYPVYGSDYNLYLNGAKIAIVFLSRLNNDHYTRRNFEIPITKAMMISQYSKELSEELFSENVNIVLFNNLKNFIDKIKYYLENDDKREMIIENCYNWTVQTHSMSSRVTSLIEKIHI